MEELLCKDGKFTNDQLEFWSKFCVTTPQEDKIYTSRSISKNSMGQWEILLNEILNPEIPIKHSILGVAMKEPAWALKRFAHLNGTPLTKEEIDEIRKSKEEDTVKIPLKPKEDDRQL